jgi:triosephosphate isomerase (TIM)
MTAFVTAAMPGARAAFAGAALPSSASVTTAPRRPAVRAAPSMSADGRTFFVGGNWKANLSKSAIIELCQTFNSGAPALGSEVQVVVAPPAVYLACTREQLRPDFGVAAQNIWGAGGAYTGEITADMVKDCDAGWVILGHSERRHLPTLHELDESIAEKAKYALKTGLSVIYCIGELLEEREAGTTMDVCVRQLSALGDTIDVADWDKIVVAYEPVWAIGTGKVASPAQAEEVHKDVRAWIASNVSKSVAKTVRILYGGSVSAGNCKELAMLPDIDGFLVGGCSLKAEFVDIIASHKFAQATTV